MPVYLIRLGDDGPVRIGHAKDVHARLAVLQTGHQKPLSVVAELPGGRAEAAELAAKLEHHRILRSWFALDAETLDTLTAMAAD